MDFSFISNIIYEIRRWTGRCGENVREEIAQRQMPFTDIVRVYTFSRILRTCVCRVRKSTDNYPGRILHPRRIFAHFAGKQGIRLQL